MSPEHYCLFDTAIGPCGVAWSAQGLTRLQLPEFDRTATEKRLRGRSAPPLPHEPPPSIEQAIASLQRYFTGSNIDFSSAALDLRQTGPFDLKVYGAACGIGWGQTTSYGELARRIGCSGGAQAVGQALGRNPIPIVIPCHRILAKSHKIGGFSAYGRTAVKQRLLLLEGVLPVLSMKQTPSS